ncbi:hypothetical protein AAT19DRAFT_13529 [Rhodotorula toruloides]|uniref:Uncharacterized protein n=1 Tax=Rhodotorula toruloides TaxID=5286 RepID=A0A2T0ABT9_RHOTO|nr:hypothetical protein AAT19DRAFT_13529 [Rhodotorula toruloides]
MLARTALRSAAIPRATLAAPRLARTYAQQNGPAAQEPINQERGPSRTPFYIGAALVVLVGGYFSGVFVRTAHLLRRREGEGVDREGELMPNSCSCAQATPPTPAVKNMQVAMHPKTEDAKMAAVRPLSLFSCRDESTNELEDAQGIREDPKDEPHKAGGDLKGRNPPK